MLAVEDGGQRYGRVDKCRWHGSKVMPLGHTSPMDVRSWNTRKKHEQTWTKTTDTLWEPWLWRSLDRHGKIFLDISNLSQSPSYQASHVLCLSLIEPLHRWEKTPRKINIEPENPLFEKENHLKTFIFGFHVDFQEFNDFSIIMWLGGLTSHSQDSRGNWLFCSIQISNLKVMKSCSHR